MVVRADDGLFHDRAHGKNCSLRRVDDGVETIDSVGTEVRDGDGSAGVFLGFDFLVSSADSEVFHGGADFAERELVGLANDRSDEAVFDCNGDREIHIGVFHHGVTREGGIDFGV